MSIFKRLLDPGGAYGHASDELKKYWDQAQKFQQPFLDQGEAQYDPLNEARQRLMNPVDLQGEWAKAYETSPEAQELLRTNRTQGLETAGSMGLMGSSAAVKNIQQGAGDIVAKDRQRFLNDLMQKYMMGIGLGSDLYHVGANAGANLGSQAMTQGQNMASMRYGQDAARNKFIQQAMGAAVNAYNQPGGNQ